MANLALILEQELEEAVEVKNPKSLHRYILLLTDNLVAEERHKQDIGEIKSDIRVIAETIKRGFEEMNRRFDDMNKRFDDWNKRFDDANKRFDDWNKRFEDMNKRFEDIGRKANIGFTYMNIILGILVFITILFKFL